MSLSHCLICDNNTQFVRLIFDFLKIPHIFPYGTSMKIQRRFVLHAQFLRQAERNVGFRML